MDKKSESAIEQLTRYQMISVFKNIMKCSINILANATISGRRLPNA
jgi:hypothetical protein